MCEGCSLPLASLPTNQPPNQPPNHSSPRPTQLPCVADALAASARDKRRSDRRSSTRDSERRSERDSDSERLSGRGVPGRDSRGVRDSRGGGGGGLSTQPACRRGRQSDGGGTGASSSVGAVGVWSVSACRFEVARVPVGRFSQSQRTSAVTSQHVSNDVTAPVRYARQRRRRRLRAHEPEAGAVHAAAGHGPGHLTTAQRARR